MLQTVLQPMIIGSATPNNCTLLVGSMTDHTKSYNICICIYRKSKSEGIPDEDGCTFLELMVTWRAVNACEELL